MRAPFAENNLAIIQTVRDTEQGAVLVTIIAHSSGESIESFVPFMVGKPDSQGVGSALTYARRYGLATACGISQTDDDGEAAMGRYIPKKSEKHQLSFREGLTQAVARGDAEPVKKDVYVDCLSDKNWLVTQLAIRGVMNDQSEDYQTAARAWHTWAIGRDKSEVKEKLNADVGKELGQ
jgi:hypothetical protein